MLQEALRNNIHLLTEDEKTYMDSFTLLSNESQRLFIRLYTRKGYLNFILILNSGCLPSGTKTYVTSQMLMLLLFMS
ncbi:hypothetical protein VIGAN_UM086700 [Vigna angularis var. angularis]|uniref:Fanconi-associated nuclease 1-like winged-helix domain-containing protein n=1 Tax=Vigna angularis var. angularis TaxID=157739 RepID=A0A0S3TEG4_PHAAN|nr:hypothetical protein VIGAN_UM086700 [Vigna angularis var. angularis]